MQVFSKDQARYIDDVTIKSGKLSSIELMKNAGIKISGFLQKKYPNNEFLDSFPLLKSREKLHQQDIIWKQICEFLNWEFIKSI